MSDRKSALQRLDTLIVATWLVAIIGLIGGIALVAFNLGMFGSGVLLLIGYALLGIGALMLPAAFIVNALGHHAQSFKERAGFGL